MKRHFTCLLICSIIFSNALQSQIEFAPIGAKYTYWSEYQNNNTGPLISYTNTMEVLSDTIINGQACRKVSAGYNIPWGCGDTPTGFIYVFESDGEVFWWNELTLGFELLYDFEKAVGESWVVPSFCGSLEQECPIDSFTLSVDSLSYVEMNGFSIKVQHVTCESVNGNQTGYSFEIYEGIGCINHFFYLVPQYCFTIHDYFRGIRCFESPVDGTFTFFDDMGDCDMIVSSDELAVLSDVKIFPNPLDDKTNIHYQQEGVFDLIATDLQGNIIISETDVKDRHVIDLSMQASGTYFVIIKTRNQYIIEKIVKI